MNIRRLNTFILKKEIIFVLSFICTACNPPINTVLDPNFTEEGYYIGETSETFTTSQPSQVIAF